MGLLAAIESVTRVRGKSSESAVSVSVVKTGNARSSVQKTIELCSQSLFLVFQQFNIIFKVACFYLDPVKIGKTGTLGRGPHCSGLH